MARTLFPARGLDYKPCLSEIRALGKQAKWQETFQLAAAAASEGSHALQAARPWCHRSFLQAFNFEAGSCILSPTRKASSPRFGIRVLQTVLPSIL